MRELRRRKAETTDGFERELLGSWQEGGPSSASREGAWSRVAIGAGIGAGAAVVAARAAAGTVVKATSQAAAASGSSTAVPAIAGLSKGILGASLAKWLIVATIASVGVATTVVVRSPSPTKTVPAGPPVAVSRTAEELRPAPAPPVPATAQGESVAAPPASSTPSPARAAQRARVSASSAPTFASSPEPQVAEQIASLDEARDALSSGEAARALRLLDAYDGRFPGGALAQEASVMRVRALVAAGRSEEARAIGRRFIAEHESSPYATHVRQMLGDSK